MPFANTGPHKISKETSDEQAVMFADIFTTGHFGADIADIPEGGTVAVFGAGPGGLFAMKSAKQFFGAGRVIAIDKVPYRLQMGVEQYGAETVNFNEAKDVVGYLEELTGGRGPDSRIDAVGLEAHGSIPQALQGTFFLQAGAPTALIWALHAVRPGGTVSVIGVYGPPFIHFIPFGWSMNRNITFRMGQTPVLRYIDDLMERTRTGEIGPSFLVTHGYEIFERKQGNCVKVLLRP